MKKLSMLGEIKKNHKVILVLWNEFLEITTSKNSLKYCYHQLSLKRQIVREDELAKKFQMFKDKIKDKLKLQTSKFYLYLKDGTCINSLYDIPIQEVTLMATTYPCFKGLDQLQSNREVVQKIVSELESCLYHLPNNQELFSRIGRNLNKENTYTTSNNDQSNNDSGTPKSESISISQGKMSSSQGFKQNRYVILEKQINRKFQPIIENIITTITNKNFPPQIERQNQTDKSKEQLPDPTEGRNNGQLNSQLKFPQNQENMIQLKTFNAINDNQIEPDWNSTQLEDFYNQLIRQRAAKNRIFLNSYGTSLENSPKKGQKLICNIFKSNSQINVEDQFLNNTDTLFQSKKLQLLEQIDQYYNDEMKATKFTQFEQKEEQENNTIEFQKIFKKVDKEDNAIRKLAHELALFKKQRNPLKIKFKDTLKLELEQQQLSDLNQQQQYLPSQPQKQQQQDQQQQQKKSEVQNENILSPPKYSSPSRNEFSEQELGTPDQGESQSNFQSNPQSNSHSQHQPDQQCPSRRNNCDNNMMSEMKALKKFQQQQKIKLMQIIAESLNDLLQKKDFAQINSRQKVDKQILKTLGSQDNLYIQSNEKLETEQSDSSDIGEEKEQSQELQIDFEDNQEKKKTYLQTNKLKVSSKKETIREIDEFNGGLTGKNITRIMLDIPKLIAGHKGQQKLSSFNRGEIHQIFTLYKTLHQVTSQRYKHGEYDINDGVDFHVYQNGLYQIYMQSQELQKRIFNTIDYNYSGFMDWNEFLKLMVIIRAKTIQEKINLFIKIADEDGNGQLSQQEIFYLTKTCIGRYIEEKNDDFLDILSEYFTKLIFQAVNINITEEIPLKLIKKTILSGNKDGDLLCMFCGADI